MSHPSHLPQLDIRSQFTLRLVGGPASGSKIFLPFLTERIELAAPDGVPHTYFTARMRQRRIVAVHSTLVGRVKPESIAGDRSPRTQIADWMARHPSSYKVCHGCESVVHTGFNPVFCPHCHSYGFDGGKEAVREACERYRLSPPIWLRMDVL